MAVDGAMQDQALVQGDFVQIAKGFLSAAQVPGAEADQAVGAGGDMGEGEPANGGVQNRAAELVADRATGPCRLRPGPAAGEPLSGRRNPWVSGG